ncbi:hypothetical protein ACFY9C_35810 [Streptomyces filamentosus]|uniref:hypothetical protein n=1 Tax=Streptomyces filamentosus TaxID=67294 RepID=UPI0036E7B0A3
MHVRDLIETGGGGPSKRLFTQVLERGIGWSEVRVGALGDLVLGVVTALARYRSKVCGSERAGGETADAVDRIMVPPTRSGPARPGP